MGNKQKLEELNARKTTIEQQFAEAHKYAQNVQHDIELLETLIAKKKELSEVTNRMQQMKTEHANLLQEIATVQEAEEKTEEEKAE